MEKPYTRQNIDPETVTTPKMSSRAFAADRLFVRNINAPTTAMLTNTRLT